MGAYGRFLARPSTTDLLRRMADDFRVIDQAVAERPLFLSSEAVEAIEGGAQVGTGSGDISNRLGEGGDRVGGGGSGRKA